MFGRDPNIVGEITGTWGGYIDNDVEATGCLTVTRSSAVRIEGNQQGRHFIGIDASKSSTIYSGSTVQPSAIQTLCCIKT